MFDFNATNETYETWTSSFVCAPRKTMAHTFVERLANDDAFRASTERDPVSAAALYGFSIDAKKLPADGIKLPAKHLLQDHLDEIAASFQASANVIIVFAL